MSEMRRLAELLVARRPVHFETARPVDVAMSRLRQHLQVTVTADAVRMGGERAIFEGRWTGSDGRWRLEGDFRPVRRTGAILQVTSVVLTALLLGSAYAFLAPEVDTAIQVAFPITTAIAILAFPFIAVALGSQREAEEARITRAIRRAFGAEEDPPKAPRQ